jgi:hypothetical protein
MIKFYQGFCKLLNLSPGRLAQVEGNLAARGKALPSRAAACPGILPRQT